MDTKTRLVYYNRTHLEDPRYLSATDISSFNYNTEPTIFSDPMSSTPSPPLPHVPSPVTASTTVKSSTSQTNIVFRNLGDVIASQVSSPLADVLSLPPRHSDVVAFNQSRQHACTAETGLPNIRTFIDEMYTVNSSTLASATDRLQLYKASGNGLSSANGTVDGDSASTTSTTTRVATIAPSFQLILDDNGQHVQHQQPQQLQQQHHHHHQQNQHQYQYHPQHHYHHHQVSHSHSSAFFSSAVSDRLLQNNLPYDDDIFFDISPSHGGVDQVSEIDDSVGFLSGGTDVLSDTSGWGHGLRLFELSSGELYDEEMPSLMSINSTPELEGIRKIQSVSSKLGIPSEPMKWSVDDVHTWLSWILSTNSLPCADQWQFDGIQLCCLGIRDFSLRLGPADTELVMTTLAQWKQLGPAAAGAGCGNGGLLTPPGGDSVSFNYTTLNSTGAYQLDHVALNNNNNEASSSHVCSSPQCSSMTVQRRHNEVPKSHVQQSIYQSKSKLDSLGTTTAGHWETPFVGGGVHLSQICDMRKLGTSSSHVIKSEVFSGHDDFRSTDDSLLYCTSSTANGFSDDLDLQSSICKSWPESPSTTNFRSSGQQSRSGRGATKRTICLWQFLRELLHQQSYQSWIRWIDRNRGIFKIEDSVRVAKLWGERKNRPAMNYDKLSRSIRQYYKKGIIQKTSNSKRLVYQFCPEYMT